MQYRDRMATSWTSWTSWDASIGEDGNLLDLVDLVRCNIAIGWQPPGPPGPRGMHIFTEDGGIFSGWY